MASANKDKATLLLRPDLLKSFAEKIFKEHGEVAKAAEVLICLAMSLKTQCTSEVLPCASDVEVRAMTSNAEIGDKLKELLGEERWRQCVTKTHAHSLSGMFIAGLGRSALSEPTHPAGLDRRHAQLAQSAGSVETQNEANKQYVAASIRPEEARAQLRAIAKLAQLSFGTRRVAEVSPRCSALLAGAVRQCVVVALEGAALPTCTAQSSQGGSRPTVKITAEQVARWLCTFKGKCLAMQGRRVLSNAGKIARCGGSASTVILQPQLGIAAAQPSSSSSQHLACRTFATQNFYGGGGFPGFGGGQPQGNSTRYYELLEIPKDADERTIKQAYKKKAMKYHPDRGGDENKFKEVSKAYEVLSNPEQRQVYDMYGEEGLDGMNQGGGGGGHYGMDPMDLFSQMFGFQAGGRPRGKPRTQDTVHEITVSLDEIYQGTVKEVVFNRNILCSSCDGVGGHEKQQCSQCKGSGRVVHQYQQGFMVQYRESLCDRCNGKGFIVPPSATCKQCKGKGTMKQKQPFRIDITPGLDDGQVFTFPGMADQAYGHDTGDVKFSIKTQSHPVFHREGDMLFLQHKLSLSEAICGFQFSTTFLDGKELTIRSTDQPVRPGDFLLIPGKGMSRRDGKSGDLYVMVEVEFPSKVDEQTREKLLDALGGMPVGKEIGPGTVVAKRVDKRRAQEAQARYQEGRQRGRRGHGDTQCHMQ